jgi:hypothetical protein
MTLQQIETALDNGQLYARILPKGEWRCRRNGATKTWKTRPGEFQIPVKAGFRSCGYVRHDNLYNFEVRA